MVLTINHINIMKIKEIILIFILISIFIPYSVYGANDRTISGYVFDVNGNGFSGVTITDNQSINTSISNSTGYYSMFGYNNSTTYILTTDKTGYLSSSLEIDVLTVDYTNANITVLKIPYLYDIWQLGTNIVNNMSVIIGLIVMGVSISIIFGISAYLQNMLKQNIK